MQLFQFTSSYRGWRVKCYLFRPEDYFNSHPHIEDDTSVVDGFKLFEVFQFTSSYRGWHVNVYRIFAFVKFQFTSSYRGWRSPEGRRCPDVYFNSHPHIEDDSDADQTVDYPKVFQFTSSYRGWPNPALMDHWFSLFQFTSSYRGWRASGFFFYRTEKFQFTSSYRGWLYWLVLNPTVFQFQFTSSYRGWPQICTNSSCPITWICNIFTIFFKLI